MSARHAKAAVLYGDGSMRKAGIVTTDHQAACDDAELLAVQIVREAAAIAGNLADLLEGQEEAG